MYHYHLHVVYIPVVEKKVLWTKRCKDPALVGTVKETITQVSSSKKWRSNPAVDENGNPILNKKGKPVIQKSYSVLRDDFYQFMRSAGYGGIERGEYGSSEVHLTVTQFKVAQEQQRLAEVVQDKRIVMNEITQLEEERDQVVEQADAARDRIKELARLETQRVSKISPRGKSADGRFCESSAAPHEAQGHLIPDEALSERS